MLGLARTFANFFLPPSRLKTWEWCERNIRLDYTSAIPGKYSTEFFPMVRSFFDYAQSPKTRRMVVMVSAQSTKTQNAINFLLWMIAQQPSECMWVMAAADMCEEFGKKRLFPAIEDCPLTSVLLPTQRAKRNKNLIQFNTMNLTLRGANSRTKLQSEPIRFIICDERREWKSMAFHENVNMGKVIPNGRNDI